ncbi:hypothetical protein GALMADRAFT_229455 [Galerina marginata CBS 339.88]|uniref:WSC domain-containing protein n=1 Tax=Galerina marginata (strain CBS 339.88) TaxID=685588 RepID=A0A067SN96_GALM3|nr:hypothetical protein GALMADRAFT_229455 [Galerina marginata CBS 339.88]
MAPTFLLSLFLLTSLLPDAAPNQNINTALPGWTFVGCSRSDNNPATRTLQEHNIVNPGMTPLLCTQFCGNFATPVNFAGTEYTEECYCDFNIQGTATKVDDSLCDMPCGGDNTLTCGGASLVSVFQNTASLAPVPENKAKVGAWTFEGCFSDVVGSNPRTLVERFTIQAGVTIESCTSQCAAAGFNISGLEFGQECWCGNSFALPASNIAVPLSDCSRACEADTTELCGAGNRLSVYPGSSGNLHIDLCTA